MAGAIKRGRPRGTPMTSGGASRGAPPRTGGGGRAIRNEPVRPKMTPLLGDPGYVAPKARPRPSGPTSTGGAKRGRRPVIESGPAAKRGTRRRGVPKG